MCTACTLCDTKGNQYFGRTMDFSYVLTPSIYACPRNYTLKNSFSTIEIKNKYCFMGIGQNISKVVFADGVNEKGLAVATLYFPNFATYDSSHTSYTQYYIDSLDMVNFILGNCEDVSQAYMLLQQVSIIGVSDPITNSIAPLHWIITDKIGNCLVVENREDGLHLLPNPIGILSNSPNFEWHMTNLQNYMNLSSLQYEQVNWNEISLVPFGQGAGGFGLPGDFTPPSRFVRSAFLKTYVTPPNTQKESIITFFHLMESVTIPKGVVITQRGVSDYTQYTSFIDLQTKEYYFKTYDTNKILHATFPNMDKQKDILEIGNLQNESLFS